ncbi:MAG TPA: acyl-CoA carboxylase epsilon subunit [Kineosporiaceae bacterium]|nr:acyl-CoA carboxylase epsilon subunit [Kineosporiaceae bacterium]
MTPRPVLRLVHGDATPEEVAAVVAAVALASAAAAPADEPASGDATTSTWADRGAGHRSVRATFTASRDGWRTSFWPR